MKKREFFLEALRHDEHRRKAWVISAFALINEAPDAWKSNPYPYRIVQNPTGHFFVDPSNGNGLTKIDDSVPNTPLFSLDDEFIIQGNGADKIPNYKGKEDLVTTYGRLILNYIIFIYPFGDKLPYNNKKNLTPSDVEALILPLLKDNPKTEEERKPNEIYVDEYIKFCNAAFHLASFTQLAVPAMTAKTITAAPGIAEFKQKLIDENRDNLSDPAVIAKIDAALVDYDAAYLKGDPGENFLITKKSREVVRKKLFGMHGGEVGLTEGANFELVENSLSQGWDINKFPVMMDSLRSGSYSRGAETQKGGESVKWLLRASSNMAITTDDCGTSLGNPMFVSNDNYKELVGFTIVANKKSIKIDTAEDAKSYVGQHIIKRSPMYCNLTKTDYCKACCGDRLSLNPLALSAAVSEYGSVIMTISLKAMHGKALQVAKMDYKTAIF